MTITAFYQKRQKRKKYEFLLYEVIWAAIFLVGVVGLVVTTVVLLYLASLIHGNVQVVRFLLGLSGVVMMVIWLLWRDLYDSLSHLFTCTLPNLRSSSEDSGDIADDRHDD